MRVQTILIVMCLTTASPLVQADRIIVGPNLTSFYDIYLPRTREEIYSSYFTLVEKRNGISKLEARLIAQFEVAAQDKDHGYQIGKPRVTEEDGKWAVRFPSSFSINDRKKQPDILVLIDQENGNVLSLGKEQE
ncbi:MAG: hypothetical protein KA403_06880 [Candidatus Omnitrophica bacterium]|nr:hypothetical protein [Candidatus Omnitrophota bacterium]